MRIEIFYHGLFGETFEDNGFYVVGGRLQPSLASLLPPHLGPSTATSVFSLSSLCLDLSQLSLPLQRKWHLVALKETPAPLL